MKKYIVVGLIASLAGFLLMTWTRIALETFTTCSCGIN